MQTGAVEPAMSSLILRSIVSVLAAKRLVRLAVDDQVAEPVREFVWKHDPPEKHRLGYVLTCHSCSSFWASAIVASCCLPPTLRYTLALSEAVLLLDQVETRLQT